MTTAFEIKDKHGTPNKPKVYDLAGEMFDGGGTSVPVVIRNCSWVHVKNFNACNSSGGVVNLEKSHHCELSEVCAWNANAKTNHKVIQFHGSTWNYIHDCAAWGTGRKIYSGSYGGNYNVIERCWGRWEGSECEGPKITFAIAYNNVYNVFRDCIGEAWGRQTVQGIFGADRMDGGAVANTLIERCCALSGDMQHGFHSATVDGITFADCVDGTLVNRALVDTGKVRQLLRVWQRSPILPRLMELAKYADPIGQLLRLLNRRALEPQPSANQ